MLEKAASPYCSTCSRLEKGRSAKKESRGLLSRLRGFAGLVGSSGGLFRVAAPLASQLQCVI
mgnify:CR=1 FL=1